MCIRDRCGDAEHFRGAAIAWGTKVEQDHVLVSLPAHAEVTKCIARHGRFSISVLASSQSDIARQYGGQLQSDQHTIDPGALDFDRWTVPVVKGACAQILCEVRHRQTVRDQEVTIGEIIELEASETLDPLVYDHGHYFPV